MNKPIINDGGFFKNNITGIIWAAFVMVLCGIPGNDLPELSFIQWMQPDKFVHLFMFAPLNYLLIRGFGKQTSFSTLNRSPKIYATIISILYGVLTEVLQKIVFVGRTCDVRDAAADALGAFCGILVFNFLTKRKNITF